MARSTNVEEGNRIPMSARITACAGSVTGGRTQRIQHGREQSGVATGVHLDVSNLRRNRLGLRTQLYRPFHILQEQVSHFRRSVIDQRDAHFQHVQLQLRIEGVEETQHRVVTETSLEVCHGNSQNGNRRVVRPLENRYMASLQ